MTKITHSNYGTQGQTQRGAAGNFDPANFDAAFVASMTRQISSATEALVRVGRAEAAATAFADGLTPDTDACRAIYDRVVADLAAKQLAQIAAVAAAALQMLRSRGVTLNPALADEIDEAVLEHTSRTVGLGRVVDTLRGAVQQQDAAVQS